MMNMPDITQEEKNNITRDTMDRLLYCQGYKEDLVKLNSKYDPHKKVKYTYEANNLKTQLQHAI